MSANLVALFIPNCVWRLRCGGDWEVHCPHCDAYVSPIPTSQKKPQQANSIYALTKKDQEEIALMVGRTYHIPVVALRYFNVYGPRQSLSNPCARLL